MRYTVDIPDLDKLQRAFAKAPGLVADEVVKAGNRSLIRYQATAKQKAPVDTGQLRGSLQVRPMHRRGSTIEGAMGTAVRHALAQEVGSGIYGPRKAPIRPRRARMLAFTVGGRKVFARQVKGVRPKWFMRDSVRTNEPATKRDFAKATEAVVAKLGRAV